MASRDFHGSPALLMIVERRVVIHEQGTLASSAHNPQVAQSLLGQLLNGFFVLTAWVLGVALAVLVITVPCLHEATIPAHGQPPSVAASLGRLLRPRTRRAKTALLRWSIAGCWETGPATACPDDLGIRWLPVPA